MGNKPELLAPAGDLEKLKAAVIYGADAVYIGGLNYGLRANIKNFTEAEMAEGIRFAHERGKRVYVTCNIFAHNSDLNGLPAYLRTLADMGADAVIISDPGVFTVARETIPDMELHVSTQANVTNYRAAGFWKAQGASRIILARELSFIEIAEIHEKTPDVGLEAFVHGAMCVSVSGRCLLSNYLTGRDANRGDCAQPCRWRYGLVEKQRSGKYQPIGGNAYGSYAITEEQRPGEYMPIHEDARGTYIMNSKDLCMVGHIPELIGAGVSGMKIEGRMKSLYYVAVTVKAYRRAIDDYCADPNVYRQNIDAYMDELAKASHRPFTTGFYDGGAGQGTLHYESASYIRSTEFIGLVLGYDAASQTALIEQRNKFEIGDTVEFVIPDGCGFTQVITEMTDETGAPVTTAPHPQQRLKIKVDKPVNHFDLIRK